MPLRNTGKRVGTETVSGRPSGLHDLLTNSQFGGQSGIRTHGTLSRTHAFQACALNRSAICPADRPYQSRIPRKSRNDLIPEKRSHQPSMSSDAAGAAYGALIRPRLRDDLAGASGCRCSDEGRSSSWTDRPARRSSMRPLGSVNLMEVDRSLASASERCAMWTAPPPAGALIRIEAHIRPRPYPLFTRRLKPSHPMRDTIP